MRQTLSRMEDGARSRLTLVSPGGAQFNMDGRQFYPNEDPYWEALDAWYWQTADDEWDDPDNIITKGGNLEISLTKETNASSHGMGYLGGMLQSWNKLCLTGGYVEMAVSLPGDTKVQGK